MSNVTDRSDFNQSCLIVLGMHRSGTSMMTRVINLLGVDLGKYLVPPREDNPKGYWEHKDIVEIHEQLLRSLGSYWDDIVPLPANWWLSETALKSCTEIVDLLRRDFRDSKLWGFKDPRMNGLMPIWHRVFSEIECNPHFIVIFRDPMEVATSLHKRGGLMPSKSLLFWLRNVVEAERETRPYPRVFISVDELVKNWRTAVDKIAESLNIDWPIERKAVEDQIEDFLDKKLLHHNILDSLEKTPGENHEIVISAYKGLLKAEKCDNQSVLDIFSELNKQINEGYDAFFSKALCEHVTGKWEKWGQWLRLKENRIQVLEKQKRDMLNTKSWKMTAPLRAVGHTLFKKKSR